MGKNAKGRGKLEEEGRGPPMIITTKNAGHDDR